MNTVVPMNRNACGCSSHFAIQTKMLLAVHSFIQFSHTKHTVHMICISVFIASSGVRIHSSTNKPRHVAKERLQVIQLQP